MFLLIDVDLIDGFSVDTSIKLIRNELFVGDHKIIDRHTARAEETVRQPGSGPHFRVYIRFSLVGFFQRIKLALMTDGELALGSSDISLFRDASC